MPFLADATNPEHISKLFSAHLPRPTQLLALRVVRYKPQRRCLIEYDLETSGSNATLFTLIGKARAKGLDKRTYALQRQLFHAGFDDDAEDEISVPEPIALMPPLQMWLQRRVPGVPSIDLLSAHLAPQLPARLAETIFKLHQCAVHPKRSHSMQDELRLLRQKLPPVAQRHPHLEKRLGRLLEQCCCVGESIGAAPVCPIHRDFYHDQVVVDGSHLYLLDLDLFALGDPALDVGNFIGHLIEYGLRKPGSATALAGQQEQMTEHYVQLAGEPLRRRILIYSALTLARQIYISTLFDSRAPFTESILALCEGRLAEIR
jgi:hypothetical protein